MNELRSFEALYTATSQTPAVQGTNPNSVTVVAVNATNVFSTVLPGSSLNSQSRQIRVANKTNVWVHINFGIVGAMPAATLNSQPFAPGSVEVVTVHPEVTGAAVFADGAPTPTSVIFTRGQGT